MITNHKCFSTQQLVSRCSSLQRIVFRGRLILAFWSFGQVMVFIFIIDPSWTLECWKCPPIRNRFEDWLVIDMLVTGRSLLMLCVRSRILGRFLTFPHYCLWILDVSPFSSVIQSAWVAVISVETFPNKMAQQLNSVARKPPVLHPPSHNTSSPAPNLQPSS